MSRKSLPVVSLALVLIVVLATAGVAYGLWSQTLIINGTVYTGSVDAVIQAFEVDELFDFNDVCPGDGYSIGIDCDQDGSLNDDWEAENKDVAECVTEQIDPYTLQVKILQGYPSFNCFVKYGVTNVGSVPIHIYRPDYFYDGVYMGSAINTDALHVNGWPPICYTETTQLEPKENAFCSLHVHVNQGAAMNATYTFQVKIFARQWNEVVPPPWRP
jgi:hypothetical protein